MADKILKYGFIIILSLAVILFPEISAPAIKSGIALCINRVIPAVFPFLVISSMLLRSGISYIAEDIAEPFTRRILKLPKCAAIAFFSGIICGFPIGAEIAGKLYLDSRISKEDAERLLMFCNNTGPSFVIGAVGADIFRDSGIGLALYIIEVASALLCAIIVAPKKQNSASIPSARNRKKTPGFSLLLHSSVNAAVRSSVIISGFVVFFSFIVKFVSYPLEGAGLSREIIALVSGTFELTSGLYILDGKSVISFIIAGALISWGGFSVHFQSSAILSRTGLSMKKYYMGKVISTAISIIICSLFAIIRL